MRFLLVESNEDWNKFKNFLMNNGLTDTASEDLIREFKLYKQSLNGQERDVYYWIKLPIEKFLDKMNDLRNSATKRLNQDKLIREGTELIYRDENWLVYYIKNYEASCKYGANTKWCITATKRWNSNGDGRNSWNEYADKNIKIFFFIDRKNNTKYALALYPDNETFEIFNEEDLPISYIPNAPIIDSIPVDYYTRDEEKEALDMLMRDEIPHNKVFNAINDLFRETDDYTFRIVLDNSSEFANILNENIPDGYFEHEAVLDGYLSPEEYEKITGEPFEDFWGGDFPNFDWMDLAFAEGKTKDEVINSFVNKLHNNVCVFIDEDRFIFYKSWEEFLYEMAELAWVQNESSLTKRLKSMASYIVDYVKRHG